MSDETIKESEQSSINWSWNWVANAVKQTTDNVTSGFAKALIENEEQNSSETKQGPLEDALDSLDDGLELAEKFAVKGIHNLSTGFANLFQSASSNTNPPPQSTLSDRYTKQIVEAGVMPSTYLAEFDDNTKERFKLFEMGFDLIGHAGRIASLIDSQSDILRLKNTIVPRQLTEQEFWKRYYFKISELELERKTRSLLVTSEAPIDQGADISWSSDEENDTLAPKEDGIQKKVSKDDSAHSHVSKEDGIQKKVSKDDSAHSHVSKEGSADNDSKEDSVHQDTVEDGTEGSDGVQKLVPPKMEENLGSEASAFSYVEAKEAEWNGWDED